LWIKYKGLEDTMQQQDEELQATAMNCAYGVHKEYGLVITVRHQNGLVKMHQIIIVLHRCGQKPPKPALGISPFFEGLVVHLGHNNFSMFVRQTHERWARRLPQPYDPADPLFAFHNLLLEKCADLFESL
jgi:hypothetical protein